MFLTAQYFAPPRPSWIVRRAMVLVLVGAWLVGSVGSLQAVPVTDLWIETQGGKRHMFSAELADTTEKRKLGLMFRQKMAASDGMLFVFPRPRPITMWMRNTYIPLDMLFIGSDGRIRAIAQRTVPHSERLIKSGQPCLAVLEINGGTVARLGIQVGDRVLHPSLPNKRGEGS